VIYSAIASFYDRMMAHVRYDDWLFLIRNVISKYSSTPSPDIFEIGGGTGKLGSQLIQSGYSYIGSDLSFDMCQRANLRSGPTICADGRNLPLKKKFDLILFLYDGINYLSSESDYTQLFSSVSNCLKPGGLFLFDITTEFNSKNFFIDSHEYEDLGDVFYTRHSFYESDTKTQNNFFTVFTEIKDSSGLFKKQTEHHKQQVFKPETITQWIPEHIFSILGIWNNYSFKKYSARSERIHFLVQKK